MTGGDGNDTLVGGGGGDQISGGLGNDVLTGGAGVDRFTFSAANDAPITGGDTITDFNPTNDLLVFTGMLTGAFSFLGAAALTTTGATQARFDDTTKVLSIDLGGDGTADMKIVLTGVNLADLDAGAFLWL
ncbi:M10 family metallopeptidase C-terminal domain-containing protein [Belnapia sp. T18]|uniref:M10 family metallopeptidase C-terminal domain-containing protein n=1 Tax=Belnapia arida TaxID=2804533 RepID=A0ABS1U2I6_9PROT|nr:M10 family metallopeptidase C-terminal domain-containing protein [Belnapia arida]